MNKPKGSSFLVRDFTLDKVFHVNSSKYSDALTYFLSSLVGIFALVAWVGIRLPSGIWSIFIDGVHRLLRWIFGTI